MKTFEEWWAEQPPAIKDHEHLCRTVWEAATQESSSQTTPHQVCLSSVILNQALGLFIDNRAADLAVYTDEVLEDVIGFELANRKFGYRPSYDVREALAMLGAAYAHGL